MDRETALKLAAGLINPSHSLVEEHLAKAGLTHETSIKVIDCVGAIDAVQLTVAGRWLRQMTKLITALVEVLHLVPTETWQRMDSWGFKGQAETIRRDAILKEIKKVWRERPGCVR